MQCRQHTKFGPMWTDILVFSKTTIEELLCVTETVIDIQAIISMHHYGCIAFSRKVDSELHLLPPAAPWTVVILFYYFLEARLCFL